MNLVTETEAKGKWCPFVRKRTWRTMGHGFESACAEGSYNRGDQGTLKCIGSECMAWRWAEKALTGFCGIAGNPRGVW